MKNSKQFARKMKDTKSGHSYWRTHGLPVPTDCKNDEAAIDDYCKRLGDPYVVVGNYYFYAQLCFAIGKRKHFMSSNKAICLKNGTLTKYFKSKKSAIMFLSELKDGIHDGAVNYIIDFHMALDEFERYVNIDCDIY